MAQSAVKRKKKRNVTLVQTGDSGSAIDTVNNEQPDDISFDYRQVERVKSAATGNGRHRQLKNILEIGTTEDGQSMMTSALKSDNVVQEQTVNPLSENIHEIPEIEFQKAVDFEKN